MLHSCCSTVFANLLLFVLHQVANAKVLVPTTGLVDAAAIAAARDLRLIAQPAAGYANIDLEAAKQRGIPVTIAPGK
jgi:glyoxylate reductase